MGKCSICHKNEAVLYIKRIENGVTHLDGVCLSCAYRTGIGGAEKFFAQNGINESNVDMISEMMNGLVQQTDGKTPEELMDMISTHLPEGYKEQFQDNIEEVLQSLQNEMNIPDGDMNFIDMLKESLPNMDISVSNKADEDEADNNSGEANIHKKTDEEYRGNSGEIDDSVSEKNIAPSAADNKKNKANNKKHISSSDDAESTDEKTSGMMDFGDFFKGLRGIFVADENGFANLMPAARGNESSDANSVNKKNDNSSTGKKGKRKFLQQFGTNLNQRAVDGKIDRMIGREQELERVVQILNRRNKNNPVLLGEPGVGKTALAEGLAVRIVEGNVPPKLKNMEVYLLDMTGMVAGTQFRGQFESRMKGVVDEASNDGNIILVIDELHNIMGAGDAEGAMNAANILKPALAKGAIRVLGSTTLNEYRRFIEKDTALERRFQQVLLEEPSMNDTFAILRGVRNYYEKHHNVIYSDEILNTTVRYADRYINERYFPDKAIDIIDEAGAKANLKQKALVVAQQLRETIADLEKKLELIEQEISETVEGNLNDLYEQKAVLTAELMKNKVELRDLEPELQPVNITNEDIASVVEMWTGIPVKAITESETEKLINLEERLHQRVIGQDKAVNLLSKAIRRSRAGFGKRNKPASFIFVGPTGVGKTELVKALSEVLFDDEKNMIRMDMSEFMEPHTVSKLIGSPPGYVGYDDGGQLTEKVRRHPYSVILLDEIEKAHADVFNILLQILDDGRLTDSHGKVVSFENTIIIMTSNAGTSNQSNGMGFGKDTSNALENKVTKVLQDLFRPEFLNRVDEIVVFNQLTKDDLLQIIDIMLKEVENDLLRIGTKLTVTVTAKEYLVVEGYSLRYGARPLRKTIRRLIEDRLADDYLRGLLAGVEEITIDYIDGELLIKKDGK